MGRLNTGYILKERYRIVKLLGQGGFGAVYKAWDINLNGPCAVKENFETSPTAVAQFQREASVLFNLRHPNLPRVFDAFTIPNQGQYLVMDFIDGEDLEEILARSGGRLPEAQVLPWIGQVCDALIYLHSQNPPIIHRDLKPSNIRITPQGQVYLVDFGLVKIFDPHLRTTMGARAVTPGYSPVEQYGQGATDVRTDIYALGATLYALFTGEAPPESIQRVLRDALVPPGQANPALSPQTAQVILRALRIDPQERFQSAAEMKADLFASQPLERVAPAETLQRSAPATMPSSSPALAPAPATAQPPSSQPPPARQSAALPAQPRPSAPAAAAPRRRISGPWAIVTAATLCILTGFAGILILSALSGGGGETPPETSQPGELPGETGALTLWHAFEADAESALEWQVVQAEQAMPGLDVTLVYKQPDEVYATYHQAVQEGGGPDLLLFRNDALGPWARQGVILPLKEIAGDPPQGFSDFILSSMEVDGDLYGLPLALHTTAMYLNHNLIQDPPPDADALLRAVRDGHRLVHLRQMPALFSWLLAFDFQLLEKDNPCAEEPVHIIEALQFLLSLQEAGAVFEPDQRLASQQFLQDEFALFIGDYVKPQFLRSALGDAVSAVRLPAGPKAPARSLVFADGLTVNPRSANASLALELARFLTGPSASQYYMEEGGLLPARMDFEPFDSTAAMFMEVAGQGHIAPKTDEFLRASEALMVMFDRTLDGGASPEEAATEFCAAFGK